MSTTLPDLPEITDEQMKSLLELFMTKGGTFKSLKGFTDDEMEAIYSVGYNLLQNGKAEDAENVFRFLCFFDHLEKKFWLGLGMCRKAQKNFAGAVDAFGFAGLLDVKDPRAPMHAAECHIALGNREAALSGLYAAAKFCGDVEKYQPIKDRAQAMTKVLEAAAASAPAQA